VSLEGHEIWFTSNPIVNRRYAFFVGAMGAAVKAAARLDSVADNPAPAMIALRSQ